MWPSSEHGRGLCLAGLILAFLALAAPLQAEISTLTGRVFDAELRPVANACVQVEGGSRCFTDAAGNYELTRVPRGRVTILVSAPGYRTDATEISLHRRFEEFVTTLYPLTPAETTPEPRAVAERVRHGNISGMSGRIELPDVGVYPDGSWNVSYHHFRLRQTGAAAKQTLTWTAIGGSPTEDFELSFFGRDGGSDNGRTPFLDNITGGQLKVLGKLTDLRQRRWPFAAGIRHGRDNTDEVFLAFDLPLRDRHRLTLVPTWDSRAGGVLLHLGFEQELLRTPTAVTSLLLEAMQTPNYQYRKFNAGLRLRYRELNALDLYLLSDTERDLRSLGVGASLLFR